MINIKAYLIKVISGSKPFWGGIAAFIGYILFPDGAYKMSALALCGAMICDTLTRMWALSKQAGGFKKAVKLRLIFSSTFWEKTSTKIKTYLIVAVLSGLAYRVTYFEQIGIFFGTFAYTTMFFREFLSNLENIEDAGGDVGWLINWTKRKQNKIMEDEGVDINDNTEQKD